MSDSNLLITKVKCLNENNQPCIAEVGYDTTSESPRTWGNLFNMVSTVLGRNTLPMNEGELSLPDAIKCYGCTPQQIIVDELNCHEFITTANDILLHGCETMETNEFVFAIMMHVLSGNSILDKLGDYQPSNADDLEFDARDELIRITGELVSKVTEKYYFQPFAMNADQNHYKEGIAYVTWEDLIVNYGDLPKDVLIEKANKVLEGEVDVFVDWMRNDVYYFSAYTLTPFGEKDEDIESNGGIYLTDGDYSDMLSEFIDECGLTKYSE